MGRNGFWKACSEEAANAKPRESYRADKASLGCDSLAQRHTLIVFEAGVIHVSACSEGHQILSTMGKPRVCVIAIRGTEV